MANYIQEAFKQFRLLEDAEDFSITQDGLDDLSTFINQAMDDEETSVDVIDTEADTQEELKKSYVGKVIFDCNVCHSNIFYNKDDIIVDEEGKVNVDDECPYCMSTGEGYTIVGEIKPFSPEVEDEIDDALSGEEDDLDIELDDELADEPIEISDTEEEEITESYRRRRARRLAESRRRNRRARRLKENIENISIDTEDETMTMTTKDDGGIMVETTPRFSGEDDGEYYDDFDMEGAEIEEPMGEFDDLDLDDIDMGDEVIAPLSDETEEDIEENSEEELEEEPVEGEEEEPVEDVEVDEFDEEAFDNLGESYFRRCYDNVNGFKTTRVSVNENLLTVDGIISFRSGNNKKTSFVFESKQKNRNKLMFEGYNKQITPNKRGYKMVCSTSGRKLIPESLKYNYKSRNGLNESVRLNGTVRRKRK